MAHGILVGGWEPWNFIFPIILGIIIPTDKLIIFQRGRSTTNQYTHFQTKPHDHSERTRSSDSKE